MLETLITILISLHIQFGISNNGEIILPNGNLKVLMEEKAFKDKINDGTIHDVGYFKDELSLDDIVVVPDVDPNSIR